MVLLTVMECVPQDDEAPLLRYLATARGALGEPLYEVHAALRLCRSRGRIKVGTSLCVHLNHGCYHHALHEAGPAVPCLHP